MDKTIINQVRLLFIFMTISCLMSFWIKQLKFKFNFNYQIIMLLLQNLGSISISYISRLLKTKHTSPQLSSKYNWNQLKWEFILSMFLVFNALFSIKALQLTGMGLYLSGRRCMAMFVLLFNYIMNRRDQISWDKIFSAIVIVIGTIIAIVNLFHQSKQDDIFTSGNYLGYLCITIVNLQNIITVELSKIVQKSDTGNQKQTVDIVFLNASKIIPILICLLPLEYSQFVEQYSNQTDLDIVGFVVSMGLVSVTSFCYNYYFFETTKNCSHFSITLSGVMKDFFQTIIGTYIFRDIDVNQQLIFGLTLSFIGSLINPYVQYQNMKSIKQKTN